MTGSDGVIAKERSRVKGVADRGGHSMRQDVVIIGGGLAGLTLALHLRQTLPGISVTVLDRRPYPVPETTFKIGESMVEVSSWYLREVLGLGDHLLDAHLPKLGLRFFMSDNGNCDIGRRPEYGLLDVPEAPPGKIPGLHLTTYNVDRGRLENHLARRCREEGVEVIGGCRVKEVDLGDPHTITTEDSALHARWVIDATGRVGFLARRMDLRRTETHEMNAVWFRLDERLDPDDWTDQAHYHRRTRRNLRWLSTNHLMGDGYWIWLIPLPSGATSVGIMADPARHSIDQINTFEKACNWLSAREPQLADAASRSKPLDFHSMKARSYLATRNFSTDRWALCGESAFFVDALYSPGGDFIAVGNTLITQMIAADLAGDRLRLSILSKFGEQLLLGMFRHYLGLYRGGYGLMGSAGVMLQKVIWDTAVYFAYNVYLFRNDRLCDFEFHRSIREENARLERLQQSMMYRFKQSDDRRSYAGHFVDHAHIEPVQAVYGSSKERLDDAGDVKARLSDNMDILEDFSHSIAGLVTRADRTDEVIG